MGRRIGHDFEGIGEQAVTRQNGRGLIIGLVDSRPAATQIIIIHGRQIIMDQRIAMDHFNGASACAPS